MSFTVRHEPLTDDDRADIELLAQTGASIVGSRVWPLLLGVVGVLCAVAGLALLMTRPMGGAALMFAGVVIGANGMMLAWCRRDAHRGMKSIVASLRQRAGDARNAVVYEIDADAGRLGGGWTPVGRVWSGAVMRTMNGPMVFIDQRAAVLFPGFEAGRIHVPRRVTIRALPTGEVIRVLHEDEQAVPDLALTPDEERRLAEWIGPPRLDGPPCREIPAEVLEGGLAQRR